MAVMFSPTRLRQSLLASSLALLPLLSKADVFTNVPSSELTGYQLVYQLAIPTNSPGWNTTGMLTGASGYSVNNAASIANGSFTRVGYYFELQGATTTGLPNGWIFVSFDAAGFTNQASKIGVPSTTSSEVYQQNISNMNVYSNVPGIVTGMGFSTGNIEFWPTNYAQPNTGGNVPNASGSTFDFGDTMSGTGGGHGSMQIHNHDLDGAGPGTAGQTLFAYNAWGAARVSELGIGNNPTSGQSPDWTLTANAGSWTTKNLQILVLVPEPASLGLLAFGSALIFGRRNRRA
jgi:hypothetical protein